VTPNISSRSRDSWLRRTLKRVPFLRSTRYLLVHLTRAWREEEEHSRKSFDQYFHVRRDPWDYECNPIERERFARQTALLDCIAERRRFPVGLEIGCAEGLFTEVLAERCESLLVLDISPIALDRARRRRPWGDRIRFAEFDLRHDPIPSTFDLIVVAGVLEYFSRPATFRQVRRKLGAALRPGGYLMVETTRAIYPIGDTCWWCKTMIVGKWINFFIANHPLMAVVRSVETDEYVITMYQRKATR
jgi:SAM-dependent methyltransferase